MTFRVGRFAVTRIEEMLTPGFLPEFLFPDFDPAILDEITAHLAARGMARPAG